MIGKKKSQKEVTIDPTPETSESPVQSGEKVCSPENIPDVPQTESKQLKEAEEKITALNEKYTRLLAEYDNYRKRASREMEEVARSAAESLMRSLLPVLDSLDRATEHKNNEETLDEYIKGIALIENMFRDVLSQAGLKPINAEGKPFDPHLHDAVLQQESKEIPSGTVKNELEKGYIFAERVLRHSKVIVSK